MEQGAICEKILEFILNSIKKWLAVSVQLLDCLDSQTVHDIFLKFILQLRHVHDDEVK